MARLCGRFTAAGPPRAGAGLEPGTLDYKLNVCVCFFLCLWLRSALQHPARTSACGSGLRQAASFQLNHASVFSFLCSLGCWFRFGLGPVASVNLDTSLSNQGTFSPQKNKKRKKTCFPIVQRECCCCVGLILEQEKAILTADLLPWHPRLCQHLLFF